MKTPMGRCCWMVLAWVLSACQPTMNWREVRPEGLALKMLLPCKAEQGSRPLQIGDRVVQMRMVGCEAGAALFAVSSLEAMPSASLATLQAMWQQAMLKSMRAITARPAGHHPQRTSYKAMVEPITAEGLYPDGRPVRVQALWFVHQGRLYHAAVYAKAIDAEIADTFFSGITPE